MPIANPDNLKIFYGPDLDFERTDPRGKNQCSYYIIKLMCKSKIKSPHWPEMAYLKVNHEKMCRNDPCTCPKDQDEFFLNRSSALYSHDGNLHCRETLNRYYVASKDCPDCLATSKKRKGSGGESSPEKKQKPDPKGKREAGNKGTVYDPLEHVRSR